MAPGLDLAGLGIAAGRAGEALTCWVWLVLARVRTRGRRGLWCGVVVVEDAFLFNQSSQVVRCGDVA